MLSSSAVACVLLAGCGNTGDPDPPATTTRATAQPSAAQFAHASRRHLTRAEFRRAADRICRPVEAEIAAFIPLGTDPATRRANRAGIIAVFRRTSMRLRALGPPSGGPARRFTRFYDAVDAALDRAAADQGADLEQEFDTARRPYLPLLAEYAPGCGE